MAKAFKRYTKLEMILLLRARLSSHVLCSFPWCHSDKVVYDYFRKEQLLYLGHYVGLKPDTEV